MNKSKITCRLAFALSIPRGVSFLAYRHNRRLATLVIATFPPYKHKSGVSDQVYYLCSGDQHPQLQLGLKTLKYSPVQYESYIISGWVYNMHTIAASIYKRYEL